MDNCVCRIMGIGMGETGSKYVWEPSVWFPKEPAFSGHSGQLPWGQIKAEPTIEFGLWFSLISGLDGDSHQVRLSLHSKLGNQGPERNRDLPQVTLQEWVQEVSALNSLCLSWDIGTCSRQGLVLGCREQSGVWASIPVRQ